MVAVWTSSLLSMFGTNVEDKYPPLFTQTMINIAKFPAKYDRGQTKGEKYVFKLDLEIIIGEDFEQ